MNISVIGTGYVGLVAGTCFAESGNNVICMDNNKEKIKNLKNGIIPIYEPGLEPLIERNLKNKNLSFSTNIEQTVQKSDIIFIAVGTPPDEDGSADLSHVLAVATSIGKHMKKPKIVVDKSTVPVGTAALVKRTIQKQTDIEVHVVSNPEFLKEGAAVDDFMYPDRVVIGTSDAEVGKIMKKLYDPFVRTGNPIHIMDEISAEMTKYAANSLLATKISFINEMSRLCELVGADIENIRLGIGSDKRIGYSFIFPGVGYGGSCFPKDVKAIIRTAQDNNFDMRILKSVEEVNEEQKKILILKIKDHFKDLKGKTVAIWGLSFKPKTDDMREAPSRVIIQELNKLGVKIQAHDPVAMEEAKRLQLDKIIKLYDDNYKALKGADCLLIVTEWLEYRKPDFNEMKKLLNNPVIFDGRNIYDPDTMKELGFDYYCIGRQNK